MNISRQTIKPSPAPSRWLRRFNAAIKKIVAQRTDATGTRGLEKKPGEILLDPGTNRPVVRDLRYHRFIAHQRECYFLNQAGEQ